MKIEPKPFNIQDQNPSGYIFHTSYILFFSFMFEVSALS